VEIEEEAESAIGAAPETVVAAAVVTVPVQVVAIAGVGAAVVIASEIAMSRAAAGTETHLAEVAGDTTGRAPGKTVAAAPQVWEDLGAAVVVAAVLVEAVADPVAGAGAEGAADRCRSMLRTLFGA
jgi:hypothetical protein